MRFVLFVPCILAQEIESTTTTTPFDTTTTGKSRNLIFRESYGFFMVAYSKSMACLVILLK